MQSQFGSLSLVAQAYGRELRADAARIRSVPMAEIGLDAGWAAFDRPLRAVGPGRLWRRLTSIIVAHLRPSPRLRRLPL